MRLAWLYLRTRPAGVAVTALAAIGGLIWLIFAGPDEPLTVRIVGVMAPVLAAAAVLSSIRSPFGDAEHAAGTRLPLLRTSLLTGLLFLAAGMLVLTGGAASVAGTDWMLARNLAGYAGLAFLGSRLLGFGNAWCVPFAYGFAALLAGVEHPNAAGWWAWPVRAEGHAGAAIAALALVAVGIIVVIREARPRRWALAR